MVNLTVLSGLLPIITAAKAFFMYHRKTSREESKFHSNPFVLSLHVGPGHPCCWECSAAQDMFDHLWEGHSLVTMGSLFFSFKIYLFIYYFNYSLFVLLPAPFWSPPPSILCPPPLLFSMSSWGPPGYTSSLACLTFNCSRIKRPSSGPMIPLALLPNQEGWICHGSNSGTSFYVCRKRFL